MQCWTVSAEGSRLMYAPGISKEQFEDLGLQVQFSGPTQGRLFDVALRWVAGILQGVVPSVRDPMEEEALVLLKSGGALQLSVQVLVFRSPYALFVLREGEVLSVSYGRRRYLLEISGGRLRLFVDA